MKVKPESDLLTIREFSEALRVSSRAIRRWIDQGLIRSIRTPGNHIRLFRVDLEQILQGREISGWTER